MATSEPYRPPHLRVAEPSPPPKPPRHLRAATRRWFAEVVGEYDLESHHVRLLQAACEAWDRTQQAREALSRDGLTVATDSGSVKSHPAIAIERDSRLAFARLLRELDLDGAPEPDPRPPRRR
jgi:P27 family predicted phage terminase small subunit